jgi:hypothetical protein
LVNKKGIKKTKVKKPETPAAEPITESASQPTLEQVESNIIGNVVRKLAPEMNKSIEAKFEEMKTIFKNELQDIRKHMEAAPIDDISEPVSSTPSEPLNAQNLTVPQAQEKAGLESLLPIIQMLGLGKSEPTTNSGLMNMFMESMMRNSMANLTRNDGMQDLMMKAAFKKILGEDPPANIMKTTNELMSPLNNYGDKAQAEREKAKNNL